MINENIFNQIKEMSKKPTLFNKDCGNIWTEEYIAKQMLDAHLNPNFDGASRRNSIIEDTVDFLTKNVLKENSLILDLGCGPGLYAEKLCKKGYKVTGIDFSENTISYAKNSAKKQKMNIEYKCDNFFNLNYCEDYDAVMQIYGEINTFSDEERDKLFKIVYNALKPNGIFIFDISTPVLRKKCAHMKKSTKCNQELLSHMKKSTECNQELLLKKNWYISEGGFWREKDHIVLEEGFQYDNDIWLDQYIIADSFGVQVYRNWFHDYTIETISEVIQNYGFNIINITTLEGKALKEDSEWIGIVAQKNVQA